DAAAAQRRSGGGGTGKETEKSKAIAAGEALRAAAEDTQVAAIQKALAEVSASLDAATAAAKEEEKAEQLRRTALSQEIAASANERLEQLLLEVSPITVPGEALLQVREELLARFSALLQGRVMQDAVAEMQRWVEEEVMDGAAADMQRRVEEEVQLALMRGTQSSGVLGGASDPMELAVRGALSEIYQARLGGVDWLLGINGAS
ncbi:hypothetical protein T484DRAFT_1852549, partial [Baffinella frigidus]